MIDLHGSADRGATFAAFGDDEAVCGQLKIARARPIQRHGSTATKRAAGPATRIETGEGKAPRAEAGRCVDAVQHHAEIAVFEHAV